MTVTNVQPIIICRGLGSLHWVRSFSRLRKLSRYATSNQSLFKPSAERLKRLRSNGLKEARSSFFAIEAHRFLPAEQLRQARTCDKLNLRKERRSTFTPLSATHRRANLGAIPLEFIEVQLGGCLGGDESVRFKHTYGCN